MGISTDVKRFIVARYYKTVLPTTPLGQAEPIYGAQVMIIDAPFKIKPNVLGSYRPPLETGRDFVHRHLLKEAKEFYKQCGRVVVVCFDTDSPLTKQPEHDARYRNKPPSAPIGPPNKDGTLRVVANEPPLVGYDRIPPDWCAYINDHRRLPEFLHYFARSVLWENDPNQPPYTPPPGRDLLIHGVYWGPGNGGTGDADGEWRYNLNDPPRRPSPLVHFVSNAPVESVPGEGVNRYERRTGVDPRFTQYEVARLVEAELAALYFARYYGAESIIIVSADGDLLPLLLMATRDRIDGRTGQFHNRVLLRLMLAGKPSLTLDINALYVAITNDPVFAGVIDPVLSLCAVSCLVKNDFLRGYGRGLGVCRKPNPFRFGPVGSDAPLDTPRPWVLETFMRHASEYGTMITAPRPLPPKHHGFDVEVPSQISPSLCGSREPRPLVREGPWRPLDIEIDEDLFIAFTKCCYVEKCEATAAKTLTRPVTIQSARDHLVKTCKGKRRSWRMPVARVARVYSRQLLWVLLYWNNGHRQLCPVPSPLARHRTVPHYGWLINMHTGRCVTAGRVSVKRRVDGSLDGDPAPVVYNRGHPNAYTPQRIREERAKRRARRWAIWSAKQPHYNLRIDRARLRPSL